MRYIVFAIAMLAPLPALALSCLRPSVERTYREVDAAKENYVVVHGRLTLDTDHLPRNGSDGNRTPELTNVPARLEGMSMGRAGFAIPFEQSINLEVACFGPWCGSIGNDEDVLAFLRQDGGRYALSLTPCGGHVFGSVRPEQLQKVQQCFSDGACEEE